MKRDTFYIALYIKENDGRHPRKKKENETLWLAAIPNSVGLFFIITQLKLWSLHVSTLISQHASWLTCRNRSRRAARRELASNSIQCCCCWQLADNLRATCHLSSPNLLATYFNFSYRSPSLSIILFLSLFRFLFVGNKAMRNASN